MIELSNVQSKSIKVNVILTKDGFIMIILSLVSLSLGIAIKQLMMIIPSLFIPCIFILFGLTKPPIYSDTKLELHVPGIEIKAKQFLPISIAVSNHLFDESLIVSVDVSDGLFPVSIGQNSLIQEKKGTTFLFYAPRRGKETINRIQLKFKGIPGLFHFESSLVINQEIIITPEPQRVKLPWKMKQKILENLVADISVPVKGRGFDFLSLRDYQYGDEVKHIHWKASAKYNKLIVKEFEEPMMLRFLIIVDSSLFMAGPKLEFALSSVTELASILHRSNHSLSVIVQGNTYTKLFPLGNSSAALRTLSINLHNVKSEGNGFNYTRLRQFIFDHKLQGSVSIFLSDMELSFEEVSNGISSLRLYMQHIFFLACNTPGFGTLALANVQDTRMYDVNEINYRRLIVEPSLARIYNRKHKQYKTSIESATCSFAVIENYDTNVLLELLGMLRSQTKKKARRAFQ